MKNPEGKEHMQEPSKPAEPGAHPRATVDEKASGDTRSESPSEGPLYLRGIGVSPGTAIGPALLFTLDREADRAQGIYSQPTSTAAEKERLRVALDASIADLRELKLRVAEEIGQAEGDIFEAQASVLEDPTIMERATELIDHEGASAEMALSTVATEQAAILAALPDPIWQARADDVRDAIERPLGHLRPGWLRRLSLADLLTQVFEPVIVVAHDLLPSDTVQMSAEKVGAIALVTGNATAHAAILARALGIPAVMGLGSPLLDSTHQHDTLVVDGRSGQVIVRPTTSELTQARSLADQEWSQRREVDSQRMSWRSRPGQTKDGHAVPLLANVGTVAEAQAAAEMGAEGIGLLRTEFLFSSQETLPDEEEQAALYEAIIRTFGGGADPAHRPIIIRTLDAGSDKPLASLEAQVPNLPSESNPALGVRGIRLQLLAKSLLVTQLRAVLRASSSTQGNIRIMLPMVATLEEIREARQLLVQARSELAATITVPIGIMVETPAAVLAVSAMARETSFLSIGTNDLTQYVMAADRLSPALTSLCQPTQPAVLQAIAAVVDGAHRAGRHVGVCGEMAGDPKLAPLLVGLGVDELSMTPAGILAVKQALAHHTLDELRTLAASALRAGTIAEVDQAIAAAHL
jgi:phosphoenolpyruvate-protein phosphotransferase